MFRLVLFLGAFLFVMLQFGAKEGAVRDGLAGRIVPLMDERTVPATPAPAPAQVAAAAQPVAEPDPVVQAAFEPAITDAPAAMPVQPGLTLALPLRNAAAQATNAVPGEPAFSQAVVQYVVGSSVNVREGPSAETGSLTKLARGEAVTVLSSDTPGWSMIRIEGDGLEGYIATRFLGDAP